MQDTVKEPRQKRSHASFEQLMTTGVALLREGVLFSVAELSERSGVSVGSIYQRFGAKEMIYLTLQDRVLSEMDAEAVALFADTSGKALQERIDYAVKMYCGHVEKYEAVLRSLIQMDNSNPQAAERGQISCQKIESAFVASLLVGLQTEVAEPLRIEATFCFRMIFAATWHRITRQPLAIATEDRTWSEFAADMSILACRFLMAGLPNGRMQVSDALSP